MNAPDIPHAHLGFAHFRWKAYTLRMRLSATTIEISTRGLQYQRKSIKPSNTTSLASYHHVQFMGVCLSIEAFLKAPFRRPEGWGERGVFGIVIPPPH